MTDKHDNDESERQIEGYYKDLVNADRFNGLPLPFAQLTVPQSGDTEGHNLGVRPSSAIVTIPGNWQVIHETEKGGYPVVLVREQGDAAVAATLSTYGSNQRYRNALLGYAPDVGTLSIAEVRPYQPDAWLEGITNPNEEQSVTDHFEAPESYQPFIWELKPENNLRRSKFVCCRFEGHRPWDVLKQSRLNGFKKLRDRYQKAATAIGYSFNPTPPDQRDPYVDDSTRDPEKGRELNKIARRL